MNKNKLVGFVMAFCVAPYLWGMQANRDQLLHPVIQVKMDKVHLEYLKKTEDVRSQLDWLRIVEPFGANHFYLSQADQDLYRQAHETLREACADIARNAGDLMTKQQKLEYICGDCRWQERKTIIKSMIEDDGVNPNAIGSDWQPFFITKPLESSILCEDVDFATYLLRHGAKPSDEVLKEAQKKPKMAAFLLAYKSQAKKKTKNR